MDRGFRLLFIITLLLLAFFSLEVSAVDVNEINHIHLLTISQNDVSVVGGVADLFLEIKPGNGAIFIESYPLSNLDTQITTRVSNEFACSVSEVDCSKYDFFYTIRTSSSVVTGPSAGVATTLLTYTSLESLDLPDDISVTGTLTSGGIVGSVGGVLEKVKGAQNEGLSKVYVPKFSIEDYKPNFEDNVGFTSINDSLLQINDTYNFTINETSSPVEELLNDLLYLENFSNINIEVVPILTFNDLIIDLYPEKYVLFQNRSLIVPPMDYTKKMFVTANKLCNRSESLINSTGFINSSDIDFIDYEFALEYYNKSKDAMESGYYYSSASYCYSANVRLRNFQLRNYSQEVLLQNLLNLRTSLFDFENQIDDKNIKTFSDLETYSIVKERIIESKGYIESINQSNISSRILSTAIERYYSAVVWSYFFGSPGKELNLDETYLKSACVEKIQETESRINYLKLFIPEVFLSSIKESLDRAYDDMHSKEYALCLFKAGKSKAEANMLISSFSIHPDYKNVLLDAKLQSSTNTLYSENSKGLFPMLGYSYLEYANNLKIDQSDNSLLFLEYALEMSKLSDYFPAKHTFFPFISLSFDVLLIFFLGFFLGSIYTIIVFVVRYNLVRKPSSKNKKQKGFIKLK